MNKCKNCGKEIKKNRVYCSLTCRNVYVNKNLRDYNKNSNAIKEKTLQKYLENPKFCLTCKKQIPFQKRENKFCDSSCAAKHNNSSRDNKRSFSKKGIENIRIATKKRTIERLGNEYNEFINNPKKCVECGTKLNFTNRKRKFCCRKCSNIYNRKHLNDYQKYYRDCQFKFALNEYPNEFDFSLIEKYGWYKAKNHGDNLNGVSRDHMFSIKEGFELGVDSKLISHPANCKLMIHVDNKKKHTKSSITVEELKTRISNWNLKYREFV